MKFFVPLALFAAAVVTAQDDNCEANYIVETCFASENKKVMDCSVSDYDCLCRASEALATCFNNCPNDPRGETYRGLIITHCQNASLYGTNAQKATPTAGSADASNTEASQAEETGDDSSDSSSATETSEQSGASSSQSGAESSETADSGVGQLARNTAGVLLAVAGAVAAML